MAGSTDTYTIPPEASGSLWGMPGTFALQASAAVPRCHGPCYTTEGMEVLLTNSSGNTLTISQLNLFFFSTPNENNVQINDHECASSITYLNVSVSSEACSYLTYIVDNRDGNNQSGYQRGLGHVWYNQVFKCNSQSVSDWHLNVESTESESSECYDTNFYFVAGYVSFEGWCR